MSQIIVDSSLARIDKMRQWIIVNDRKELLDYSDLFASHLIASSSAWCTRAKCNYTYMTTLDEVYNIRTRRVRLYLNRQPVHEIISLKVGESLIDTSLYSLVNQRYIYYPTYFAPPSLDDLSDVIRVSSITGFDNTGWKTKLYSDAFGVPGDVENAIIEDTVIVMMKTFTRDFELGQGRVGIIQQTSGASGGSQAVKFDTYIDGHPKSFIDTSNEWMMRASLQ